MLATALALLVAGYDKLLASDRTRLEAHRFFGAVGQYLGLEDFVKPDWKETKRRSRLRIWAKEVGIKIVKAERAPTKWGPPVWSFLKELAGSLTTENKDVLWTILANLGSLLPCPKCRKHYPDLLDSARWALVTNSNDAVKYVKWMHSKVDKRERKTA